MHPPDDRAAGAPPPSPAASLPPDADETQSARLAAIIDSSDDAIVSKTLEGVVTSWNAGAERIFGYTAEEAVGRHISLIIPADRLSEEDEVLRRLGRGERIDHFETIRRRKDGRLINISLTVSPIRNRQGVIVGASKVARDITDRVLADKAIAASRQRYRRIFESAGVSIWDEDFSAVKAELDTLRAAGVTDVGAYFRSHPQEVERLLGLVRVTDVNQETIEMFGATDRAQLLRSLRTIFDERTMTVFIEELVAIARGDTRFSAEAVVRTVAGERRDVMVNITFPEPHESFDSVLVSLTDITARKQAEDHLKQEVHVRETLARVGASLAAELDSERLVQAVTDAATALTTAEFGALFYNVTNESGESYQLYTLSGAPREAFAHYPQPRATELFGPTFRGEGVVRIDDVLNDPRYGKSAPHHGLPKGHLPVRSYLAVPIRSRTGDVLGGLFFGHSRPGVFQLMHEQLASGIASWAGLALDNAALYKQAQEANRMKDEFLATLSHELRTPLNAVLGWSHMLATGTLTPDVQKRAVDAIERNSRAQAQLVDDLLDVSRIVSGRMQIKSAEVDLASVVLAAVDTVRPAIAAKGLHLELFEIRGELPIIIGDADRLRQVFWNLLTNAVKFTPAGGHIRVRLHRRNQAADVVIQDDGQGIKREFLPYVFERFRQADSTASRRHGGLGLGLAIVRHLVEAHGGSVRADSGGEGHGATFTVRLPVQDVRQPSRHDTPPPVKQTTLAGLSLLVVDDETDARELLRTLLESHGARVVTAASAGQAIDLFVRHPVDAILADLGMPDQDGFALLEALRALPESKARALPAIAVTAYAGLRERARAVAVGYGWHVTKPVDPDQLISVVEAATQGGRG